MGVLWRWWHRDICEQLPELHSCGFDGLVSVRSKCHYVKTEEEGLLTHWESASAAGRNSFGCILLGLQSAKKSFSCCTTGISYSADQRQSWRFFSVPFKNSTSLLK